MPKLKIDGLEIEVPKGTKVINAAERLGIIIPRFCYHPALGPVGSCRICAVNFLEGPVKGVQMSCMTDAQDGMVVSTGDDESVDYRKHVIEWLMINHPHDCPVCDEGGECLLQDMTVSSGHGIRRFPGRKWTYRDQYLGPFVHHEMNRCIHCWRCRRFYQEFAGYRDLGVMQIAYRTYFGRFSDGPLESPFAGNLNDICPTGVYTDKPSRYRGRRWDFQRHPSVCIHCSLGCSVVASTHYREVVRMESRLNEQVNGYFICDRGRYGFQYESHPERPRGARVDGEEVRPDDAIRIAGERLSALDGRVACQGSVRTGLENQAMLKRLCRVRGWGDPAFFTDDRIARNVKTAASCLDDRLAVSMREIEKADFIAAVGADPVNEAPMLALAMRQASRQGATVVVMDPRPISLPFPFHHVPVTSEMLDSCFASLMKGIQGPTEAEQGSDARHFHDAIAGEASFDDLFEGRSSELRGKLEKSQFTVVICGTDVVNESTPRFAADAASLLLSSKKKVGLFYVMPGANAFSAGLLMNENASFSNILRGIEDGATKALLVVESDPFWSYPDQERLDKAITKLDLLIVIDHLPSKIAQLAHIFIPSSTVFETESGFVNQEGRIQFTRPVYSGGIPMNQISGGGHPPRVFRSDIPGSDPRPAWKILDGISAAMAGERKEMSKEDLYEWLQHENPSFAGVRGADFSSESRRVALKQNDHRFSVDSLSSKGDRRTEDSLHLLLVDWTFGTEELSSYSKCGHPAEKPPSLLMHPEDAERLTLHQGEKVLISLDTGDLEVELRTEEKMARKVAALPRHRQLEWQKVGFISELPIDRIKKA